MTLRSLLPLIALLLPAVAGAQKIQMKDGRVIQAKQLRRTGDTIMATQPIATQPGAPAATGEFGYKLAEIATLEFGKPSALDTVPDLIAAGQAEKALEQIEPVINYFGGFRDVPGSWWADAVPLKIQALLALKRDKEAAELADSFSKLAENPDNQKIGRLFGAISLTRKGDHSRALPLYDDGFKATRRPDLLSLLAANRGDSYLALADDLRKKGELKAASIRYEDALLSYMRIPALYPSQRMFLPQCIYGAARAFFGMEDFPRARAAIQELQKDFSVTPEGKAAAALLEQVEKRAAVLADPTKAEPSK
jgi:tetratricopeptide (TPR) repeat protein